MFLVAFCRIFYRILCTVLDPIPSLSARRRFRILYFDEGVFCFGRFLVEIDFCVGFSLRHVILISSTSD